METKLILSNKLRNLNWISPRNWTKKEDTHAEPLKMVKSCHRSERFRAVF